MQLLTLCHFFINQITKSWNIGDIRKLFLRLKTNLGHYLVVLTTSKISPKDSSLTLDEMQQLQNIEKVDCRNQLFASNRQRINADENYV